MDTKLKRQAAFRQLGAVTPRTENIELSKGKLLVIVLVSLVTGGLLGAGFMLGYVS